jgi:chorismate dehydratase
VLGYFRYVPPGQRNFPSHDLVISEPDNWSKLRLSAPETADELARRLEREHLAQQRQRESSLESAAADLKRVGSVPYLNAVPLTRGLEDQIVFAPPSQLARMLQQDQLDAALVSVAEVLLTDRYDILDGIAIASLGEVKSVLLAHRKPLAEIKQVFCDTASLTSVQLLRVLLAERGFTVEVLPLPDYEGAARLDAVMLIGDPALDFVLAPHEHEILDLGAEWYEQTKLPFVYAVWALRRGADTTAIRRVLREAKDFGMDTLDHIIRNRTEYDYDFRKDYLGWHIHYHLGTDEKRGLAKFAELLRKHGAGRVHEPRFVS